MRRSLVRLRLRLLPRILKAGALACCVATISISSLPSARAEGVEGAAAVGEGHEAEPQCTATSSDEECKEYWERHINWLSWDYKKPHELPEHRHMPPPFGFALFNFAVFALIMYRLAARPLADFTRTRHTTIKHDLDEAAQLHREAEAKLREYEQRISGLDGEIEALLAGVRAEAAVEKQRIVAGAEEQARKLKKDAEAQIALELERVRRDLKVEAVSAAVAAAAAFITASSNESDQVRLADRFIADLEKTPTAAVGTPSTRS